MAAGSHWLLGGVVGGGRARATASTTKQGRASNGPPVRVRPRDWHGRMALVAYLLSHAGVVQSSAWCVRGGDMILGAPIEVQSAVPVPPPSPAKIGWTGKRHAWRGVALCVPCRSRKVENHLRRSYGSKRLVT